ncbi:MAG: CoA-binding protein [Candidatus Helarchaeota archaeon]
MKDFDEFKSLFNPRGIAIIGASSNYFSGGSPFVISLLSAKFPKIYPINPKHEIIFGLKAYPSLLDVPEPVDYVIIAIPKSKIMQAIDDCIKKGVKIVCSFTSGFSELGTEEGKRTEEEIVKKLRKHNIRLLGPNCIGLYSSESRITFNGALYNTVGPDNVGNVSIISQSGGNTDVFIGYGHYLGLKFNKAVSYGNGADINSDELLEFFGDDPETNLILEYLEGFKSLKQASNYLKILKNVSKKKPVVVWLGGMSESGARAIKSHTGSIAGDYKVSSIALKQNGAIQVNNGYDLIHTGLLISMMKEKAKLDKITRDIVIVGGGGGNSVQYADIFSSYNLNFPKLDEEVSSKIINIVGEVGTLLKNPIDLNVAMFDMNTVKQIIQVLDSRMNAVIVYEPGIEWFIFNEKVMREIMKDSDSDFVMILKQNLKSIIRLERKLKNPLLIMSPSYFQDPDIIRSKLELEKLFTKNNIPVFSHLDFLGEAISNVIKYKTWLKKIQK